MPMCEFYGPLRWERDCFNPSFRHCHFSFNFNTPMKISDIPLVKMFSGSYGVAEFYINTQSMLTLNCHVLQKNNYIFAEVQCSLCKTN